MSQSLFTTVEALDDARTAGGLRYLEFLRVPDLSAGLYVLEAGTGDPQKPHAEDEVYVVIRGRCRFGPGRRSRRSDPIGALRPRPGRAPVPGDPRPARGTGLLRASRGVAQLTALPAAQAPPTSFSDSWPAGRRA